MNREFLWLTADDFGYSAECDMHIKDCIEAEKLSKISAFAISGTVLPEGAKAALHLNLTEGKSLLKTPVLTDKNGEFRRSFFKIFTLSLGWKKEKLREELKAELGAQIDLWRDICPSYLMLDSHQHVHMIPMVFRTIMEIIREKGLEVEYLRIPAEPILPYLRCPKLYFTYSFINIIKQWVLKIFYLRNRREFKKSGIKSALFMGVLFSGKMDKNRVLKVLSKYKKNRMVEVLFHPGYESCGKSKFYKSEGRKMEYDALMKL